MDRSSSLADSLKAMTHAQFIQLSSRMYGNLLDRLRVAQQVGELLQSVIGEASSVFSHTQEAI